MVKPLARLVADEAPAQKSSVAVGTKVARYVWLSVVAAVIKRGFRTAARRAVGILRRPKVP